MIETEEKTDETIRNDEGARPLVAVIMGSKSDWETMRHADELL